MGSLAAFYLQAAGFEVRVLNAGLNAPDAAAWSRELRFLPGTSAANESPNGDAWLPMQLPWARSGSIDFVLLATKAGQTAAALSQWLPLMAPDVTIVCLQNGMGQLDNLALPQQARLLPAITTNAAYRQDGRITVVAENTTFMGDGNSMAPAWFDALADSWPGLTWCVDIHQRQLAKLAVNALINPLSAKHRCPNGALLTPALHAELAALAAEIDTILLHLDASWPCDAQVRAEQVAELTAGNTSSMLADVLAGRPTEIQFINGYLLCQAERLGVDAPLNRALLAKLA